MTAHDVEIARSRAVIDRPYNRLNMKKRKLSLLIVTFVLALLTLSAVSVDRLKAHVIWLADPAREGRR